MFIGFTVLGSGCSGILSLARAATRARPRARRLRRSVSGLSDAGGLFGALVALPALDA